MNKPDTKSPHPVDVYVGARLKERRTILGVSQEVLADAIGLTFQQVQKYERGSNRISASKLYLIGRELGVPVTFFFNGYTEEHGNRQPLWESRPSISARQQHRAVHALARIRNADVRIKLLALATAIGKTGEET